MNSDKIYAEAIANEYSVKASQKVSPAKTRQMDKTPCKNSGGYGWYHILIIKYPRLGFADRAILFCRYCLQAIRYRALYHRYNRYGNSASHL